MVAGVLHLHTCQQILGGCSAPYGGPCPGVRQHLLRWLSSPLLCGTYGLLPLAATELPRLAVATPRAGGHSLRTRPPSCVQGRGAVTRER